MKNFTERYPLAMLLYYYYYLDIVLWTCLHVKILLSQLFCGGVSCIYLISILLEVSPNLLSFAHLSPLSYCLLSLLHRVPPSPSYLSPSVFFLLPAPLLVFFLWVLPSCSFSLVTCVLSASPCFSFLSLPLCASSPCSSSLSLIEAVLLGGHSHPFTLLERLPPALQLVSCICLVCHLHL